MLGSDMVALLERHDDRVTPVTRADLDILDAGSVLDAAAGYDVVVNCAGYTAVDQAETDEGAAFDVNGVGTANLARAATAAGARLVHVSTDYVFAGTSSQPYPEDAPLRPASAYGRSKAAGEWAVRAAGSQHLVLRTAWLYGAHGSCFPRTMARLASRGEPFDVVDDQVGQPTWTADLAHLIRGLVLARAPGGVYHGTSAGMASWFDFARAVVAAAGADPEMVRPTTTDQFPRPARRPAYSVLGHDALRSAGVRPIGQWEQRWDAAATTVLAPEAV